MFRKTLSFLVFLCICQQVYSYLMTEEDSYLLAVHSKEKYLFWSGCIILMAMIRYFVKTYDIPISPGIFLIFFGLLWGIASMYVEWMYHMAKNAQSDIILNTMADVFKPVLIFSMVFYLDTYSFFKCLSQIIIISAPVAVLSGILTGIMMELVSDSNWNLIDAIILGSITSCIYPLEVLKWFNESNLKTKYLACLLHGECVVSVIVIINMNHFLLGHRQGWIIHWYQFVANWARIFIFGMPIGYTFGVVGVWMMKFIYNRSSLLMLFSFSSAYISYFIGSWIAYAGLLNCTMAAIMMARERTCLSIDIQERLNNFWMMINYILTGIVLITISVRAPSLLSQEVDFKEYILVFVTYLVSNVTRFLSFTLFLPILSRTGYGMTFKNLIICVWCGLKNPICLLLSVGVFTSVDDPMRQKQIFLHILGLYFLTLLVNGSFVPVLLRALGMSEISTTRQTNMNNCMKFIYDTRSRTMGILKMDRFLADANWPLVLATTSLKHPYRKFNILEDLGGNEDEEDFFLGYKFTFCPDCQKHIPNEPTRKEIKEMTKEAKMRILKMRKCIYSRQYEVGLLSKKSLRILHQAVELALDTDHATIEIQNLLSMFQKENKALKYLQTQVTRMFSEKSGKEKLPKKRWEAWSYIIVNHVSFKIVMYFLVLLDTGLHVYDFTVPHFLYIVLLVAYTIFLVAFFSEFLLKIMSHSHDIFKVGLPTYFKSFTNMVQFGILLCTFSEVLLIHLEHLQHKYLEMITSTLLLMRIVGWLSYVRMLSCTRSSSKSISIYFENKINKTKSLAFELATNYVITEEEILQNLRQIVDNEKVRNKIKDRIERDRRALSRRVALFHKEKACVVSSLKTKAAINAVLNSMKEELNDLKVTGWVDDVEYDKLLASLDERYKFVNTIKFIEPCSPKVVFEGLPYITDDVEVARFLYSNIATRRYDPGGVVIEEGEVVDGIYILITGSFFLTYIPNNTVIKALKEMGALPVVDYICANQFDTVVSEYSTPGNTIGELSILTGRGYDGQVIAETHSEALFLSSKVVKQAIENDRDPVCGFECRMWKACTFYTALGVLTNLATYRVLTYDKIFTLLERAFVPNLSNYKIFVINSMMHDIILLYGIVIDFNTRDVYIAPCYIPRAVQKLIFPRSSLFKIETKVETKLMILPEKDFDEYEIMLVEEQNCVLDESHDKKQLHKLLHEGSISSKNTTIKHLKDIKKKMLSQVESAKSHITFVAEKNPEK